MKQLEYLLLLWLFPIFILADHVHWLGDYDTALQLAQIQHKPLLVLLVKKDDKASAKIIQNSFMNQPYIHEINQKMVPVMVMYEGKASYPVEMYYTTVFPTLFLVDTRSETFMNEPLYGEQISQKVLLQYFQPSASKIKSPQR